MSIVTFLKARSAIKGKRKALKIIWTELTLHLAHRLIFLRSLILPPNRPRELKWSRGLRHRSFCLQLEYRTSA